MRYFFIIAFFVLLSFFLTFGLRRYAIARNLIDVPNSRSSHAIPTPRGGGVAIIISFLLAGALLFSLNLIPSSLFLALLFPGLLVAVLGFVDDHGHVSARWRLLGHFAASLGVLCFFQGAPSLSILGAVIESWYLCGVFAVFYLVWMINLYNFMDGIDGLASVEALTVTLSAAFLYWWMGFDGLVWAPLIMAAAVTGFLFLNFPPARIFMGDAGSGFIGLVIGIFSLYGAMVSPQLLWSWLILLGVFIVDATYTLGRRLLRGEKIYEAHRSHAYQSASRVHGSHLVVTLTVSLINIFWLLPIAAMVACQKIEGFLGVLIAYLPVLLLARTYRAGEAE
ncbi:Fuc2NAc and GlcNAc transferase [Pseudomonas sp. IT-P2]|jgi:Fuc2NAc and GlcNAc transferase|uniref:MraY family glycosyltransferase n=1 Tax=Pseudomonas sp. IT-P2 TaxID=3026456 RepID=UPI0039E1EC7A